MQSQADRIKKVAPPLQELVKKYDEGTYKGGAEALNAEMMAVIEKSGLMKEERKLCAAVGVHPDNRQKAMLIAVDAQNLLLKFADYGYNPRMWDALALTVPAGAEGDRWREENEKLVRDSDGLLAPIQGDSIEIVTGRGSHGTGACRIAEFGAKSIHEKLADSMGNVSKAKLLELQPSWQDPLQNGLLYKILPGELELAVPGLLACLSLLGNASNDVYRQPSELQLCARIHALIASHPSKDEAWVLKQACVGYGGSESEARATQLLGFVVAWSGGKDAGILRDLAKYEGACNVKRKLAPADLQALASADLLHAPRYVAVSWFKLNFLWAYSFSTLKSCSHAACEQLMWHSAYKAMVKAMLMAPTADTNGYSNLFAVPDFFSLRAGGSNRNKAVEASEWMVAASDFIAAYGSRLDKASVSSLINTLEVRMVMQVHLKTAPTRASFSSLQAIAQDFYVEAKKLDNRLPLWNKLPEGGLVKPTAQPKRSTTLRETGTSVNDGLLHEKGFKVDTIIVESETGHTYQIVSLNADEITVSCKLLRVGTPSTSGKKKVSSPPQKLNIDRVVLLQGEKWSVSLTKEQEFLNPDRLMDSAASFDLRASIMQGAIKNALALEFQKSSEEGCQIQVSPSLQIVALKKFSVRAFKLVGLTNNVQVLHKNKDMLNPAKCIGEGGDWKVYIRSSNESLQKNTTEGSFFCKYWAVQSTFEQAACNCAYEDKEIEISVVGEKFKIKIPMLHNTKPLSASDEIVALKVSEDSVEPPSKKPRVAPKTSSSKRK